MCGRGCHGVAVASELQNGDRKRGENHHAHSNVYEIYIGRWEREY